MLQKLQGQAAKKGPQRAPARLKRSLYPTACGRGLRRRGLGGILLGDSLQVHAGGGGEILHLLPQLHLGLGQLGVDLLADHSLPRVAGLPDNPLVPFALELLAQALGLLLLLLPPGLGLPAFQQLLTVQLPLLPLRPVDGLLQLAPRMVGVFSLSLWSAAFS